MNSLFEECFVYLMFAGMVQGVLAILVAFCFFPIALRIHRFSFRELFSAYFIFNVFLLLWGCIGSYTFLRLTLGKFYVSMDRVLDWSPFIPFGQWVLDQTLYGPRGYLIGDAALWELRIMWGAFAVAVWLLTYVTTALTIRRLVSTRATHP